MSTTIEAQPTKIDLAAIQTKVIHLFVFGHGTVGSKLIDQIVSTNKDLLNRRNLDLKIVGVGNSQTMFFEKEGVSQHWREEKELKGIEYTINDVIQFVKEQQLDHLIAIDNTASDSFIAQYATLIEHGFHVVSSNKLANTSSYNDYTSLRKCLQRHKKKYLYETNVGAGLPLIDTI